jgi:hypothetical protein
MIYFLNFIFKFFMTLQFTSRFNLICYQLRLNQGLVRKRIRERKKKDILYNRVDSL